MSDPNSLMLSEVRFSDFYEHHPSPVYSYLTNIMPENCDRSVLNIFGNLFSIITFVLGVVAYYITYYTLTRSAPTEINILKLDLDITHKQLVPNFECCNSEECLGPLEPNGALAKSIEALQVSFDNLYREIEGLQKEHGHEKGCWKWEGVKNRLMWVRRRKEVMEKMRRFERQQVGVHMCHMGFLLRKLAAQEHGVMEKLQEMLRQNFS